MSLEGRFLKMLSQTKFQLLKQLRVLQFLEQMHQNSCMAEPLKRNSTRPKKVPKYLQLDEPDYGNYSGSRISDVKVRITQSKDTRNNTLQSNQLSKLLIKFLSTCNQKLKDHQAHDVPDCLPTKQTNPHENDRGRDNHSKNNERRIPSVQNDPNYLPSNKTKEPHERVGVQNNKVVQKGVDKKSGAAKNAGMLGNIQSDLNYHTMLGEHIKSNISDIRNLSPNMLMQLGLPKQLMQQQHVPLKGESKQREKKKKQFTPLQIKGTGKQMKQDLKPFKRQSYHIAIAYHIHLKHVRSGNYPSARDIDPTFNARKLREQSAKGQ